MPAASGEPACEAGEAPRPGGSEAAGGAGPRRRSGSLPEHLIRLPDERPASAPWDSGGAQKSAGCSRAPAGGGGGRDSGPGLRQQRTDTEQPPGGPRPPALASRRRGRCTWDPRATWACAGPARALLPLRSGSRTAGPSGDTRSAGGFPRLLSGPKKPPRESSLTAPELPALPPGAASGTGGPDSSLRFLHAGVSASITAGSLCHPQGLATNQRPPP